MDILAKARQLEARLARTVDRAAARVMPAGGREPLEIAHAVVDAVEREVQPAGRGRHLFPFNRIRVAVAAPSPHARARFEATFADGAHAGAAHPRAARDGGLRAVGSRGRRRVRGGGGHRLERAGRARRVRARGRARTCARATAGAGPGGGRRAAACRGDRDRGRRGGAAGLRVPVRAHRHRPLHRSARPPQPPGAHQ